MNISIHNYLPHTEPMLMVDQILQISQNEVITSFKITTDTILVNHGHFSEVGLIENAAQTCSAISGQFHFDGQNSKNSEIHPSVLGYISSIKKLIIHQLPAIDTIITSKANLLSQTQGNNFSICLFKVAVYHNDTLFLEGEMNLFLENIVDEKK